MLKGDLPDFVIYQGTIEISWAFIGKYKYKDKWDLRDSMVNLWVFTMVSWEIMVDLVGIKGDLSLISW